MVRVAHLFSFICCLFGLLSSSLCPRFAYASGLSIVNFPALFGLLSSGLCPRFAYASGLSIVNFPALFGLLSSDLCPRFAYASGLSIVNCPSLFGLLSSSLCPRLPMPLDCPLLIALLCLVCCRPVYAQGCLCL
jgi:hypothetical protein